MSVLTGASLGRIRCIRAFIRTLLSPESSRRLRHGLSVDVHSELVVAARNLYAAYEDDSGGLPTMERGEVLTPRLSRAVEIADLERAYAGDDRWPVEVGPADHLGTAPGETASEDRYAAYWEAVGYCLLTSELEHRGALDPREATAARKFADKASDRYLALTEGE